MLISMQRVNDGKPITLSSIDNFSIICASTLSQLWLYRNLSLHYGVAVTNLFRFRSRFPMGTIILLVG